MEKLVEKINDKINEWTCPDIDKYADGSYSLYLSFTELSAKDIASEVKDIAIAFERWKKTAELETSYEVKPGHYRFRNKTDDELFTSFLKEYLK